jgi:hypothetical protein
MRLLSSAIASSLLLAPTLLAQVRPPEVEPNDTAATANVLAHGVEIQANMTAAEQDWYTFTIASAARVRLHTSAVDTRLTLLDATGTTLLGLDDDGRTSSNAFASELFLNLQAGTYLAKVEGYSATTAGAYTIEYGLFPLRTFTAAEVEPNDAYTSANVVTIPSTGALINASVGMPVVQLSNSVVSATTTSITGAAGLTAGAYTPAISGLGLYYVRFTSGVNAGLSRQISSNTATAITCTAFATAPAAGDTYVIEKVDTDFYRVTLTAPRTGLWFLVTEGNAPFVCGHRYEVYDAAGALVLASSTTASAFGTNAANSSSLSARTSSIRVWPAGTYHIAVRSPSSPFTAPYNQITTGNYCLEFYAGMTIGTGSTVAEIEPNDTIATATPMTFGQRGTGNLTINTGADVRDIWGPFVVPTNSPVSVTFQSARGTPTPIADTTINILNSTGSVAVAATTGNILDWTSHGRTTQTFQGGGTYYVEVVSPGTGATQAGDYVIEVSDVMAAPFNTASYTLTSANAACGAAPFPAIGPQSTSERPTLGEVFTRNVGNCPASAPVIMMTGLSSETWNGVPLPFDLTALGAPGCTLNVEPLVLDVALADAAGRAEFNLALPGDPSLRGIYLWEQAVVQNAAANTFGAQVSNYARIITGDRSY